MSDIPRTFINDKYIDTAVGVITINIDEEVHHLKNVLRLKKDDRVLILDGNYNCYLSAITSINSREILLSIIEKTTSQKYPAFNMNLIQGITKGEKQDLIIQKATELGVTKIINIPTEYSNVRFSNEKAICQKEARWQKIALNAAKQSQRSTVPEIKIDTDLSNTIKNINAENSLIFACVETDNLPSIKHFLKENNDIPEEITFFIGPEGGWSEKERDLFNSYNIQKVSIGQNILRAETASIMVIGILIYEYQFK